MVVAEQSADMRRGAEDLSRRAESQAASLEQTSASMTQIASSAESNASSAAETDTAAANMNEEAGRAREVLDSTVAAMRDIERGSKEIEAIVDVIEDIAFQTNLLSLNASVEAARAGEAGKGFAVVANEVRALAQRSAEASSKVQAIIAQSTTAISRGSEAVEQTGSALEQIVSRIGVVSANLREIKSASEEQATAVKDISNAFGQLDKITQKNAAVAEQTRGTAGLLSSQSKRMQDAVGKVILRQRGRANHAEEALPQSLSVA
jgi:methyl-accepting chemotaxis protein